MKCVFAPENGAHLTLIKTIKWGGENEEDRSKGEKLLFLAQVSKLLLFLPSSQKKPIFDVSFSHRCLLVAHFMIFCGLLKWLHSHSFTNIPRMGGKCKNNNKYRSCNKTGHNCRTEALF